MSPQHLIEILQERDQLKAEVEQLQAQLNAAKRGMDSAAAAGRLMLEKGQKLAAENSPKAIESEREANAVLTAENERLQAEVEQLKKGVELRDQQNADLHDMIADVHQERDQLKTELANLQSEVTNLRGLKPEIPPMPGEDWPKELPRYILRWNGHNQPTSVPHKDGYWTPWYLANRLYAELERERKAAKTACENWGEMKQERDQLAVEVAALKPYRDNHHDLIRHMAAHDAEVIEQLKNKLLEFAKKSHRHRGPGIEFAVDLMDDRIDQLRQRAKEQ
jgi:small-conductance mechanosensitive channel